MRQHGPIARALGLQAVALDSNPILISGLDLLSVVLSLTLPRFVNTQLVASCQLRFLINHVSGKLVMNCFFQIIKEWGACNLA